MSVRAPGAALAAALLVGTLAAPASAQHVPLPPVNLGGSSFVDGAGGPGAMAEILTTTRRADRFMGPDGATLPGGSSLTAVAVIRHLAFTLPGSALGFHYGADVLVPLVHVAVESGENGARGSGIGDVIVDPVILQGTPILASGRTVFAHRFALGVILPTARYDRAAPVNVGSNVVSIDPYYAFTIFWTDAFETSFRAHYFTSTTNDRPPVHYEADRIRPGHAVHANGAASYALTPEVRVGVSAYWLQQITDAEIDAPRTEARANASSGSAPASASRSAASSCVRMPTTSSASKRAPPDSPPRSRSPTSGLSRSEPGTRDATTQLGRFRRIRDLFAGEGDRTAVAAADRAAGRARPAEASSRARAAVG